MDFKTVFDFINAQGKIAIDMVELVFAGMATGMAAGVINAINMVGGDADTFVTQIKPIISGMFLSKENSLKSAFTDEILPLLDVVNEKTKAFWEGVHNGLDIENQVDIMNDLFLNFGSEFGQAIVGFFNVAKEIIAAQTLENWEVAKEGQQASGEGGGGFLQGLVQVLGLAGFGGGVGRVAGLGAGLVGDDFFQGVINATKKFFGSEGEEGEITSQWSTGLGGITKTNDTFLTDTNTNYTTALGKNGVVINTMDGGINTLKESADGFDTAMNKAASGISGAISVALSAADRAVSQAERYARLIRNLSSSRSD